MPTQPIHYAVPDPERLRAFEPCMDDYGVGSPGDPWANNCLANDAVAYSNGLIARVGTPIDLRFDPDELALCIRLGADAASVMGPYWPGMYSAADTRTEPFYAVSAAFGPLPSPNADAIRAVFGNALYPDTEVTVERLAESGGWWDRVKQCVAECQEDDPDGDYHAGLGTWRSVIRWFSDQPELHGSSFVQMHVESESGVRGGCVFPWLVVGLTKCGSLVGISTRTVES
jgi:hypothetical protein